MRLLNCKIDYLLFTDDKIEIKKENVIAYYEPLRSISFEENKIDIKDKTYTRKTEELELIIDAKNKKCVLKYDDYNSLKFDIQVELIIKNDKITLSYILGEEKKKLIITMKEVKL